MRFKRMGVVVCAVLLVMIAPNVQIFAQDGSGVPITAENATQVQEISRLGDGNRGATDISPDGRWLAMPGTLGIWLQDLDEVEGAPRLLDEQHRAARTATFSPDGSLLAVGYSTPTFTVDIWDMATETVIQQFTHEDHVTGIDWSPDGQQLVVGGSVVRQIRVWDVASGEVVSTLNLEVEEGYSLEVADVIYLDQTTVLVGLGSGAGLRWDITQDGLTLGEADASFGPLGWLNNLVISPDGTMVSRGVRFSDPTAPIFSAETGEQIALLDGHTDYVNWVDFSPDGQWVVTASSDGTFKVWSIDTWEVVQTIDMHHGNPVRFVAFTPNGQQIVSDSVGRVVVYDLESEHVSREYDWPYHPLREMALSSDGSMAATAGYASVATIRSTATGEVLQTLIGHTEVVEAIAFSADGSMIATGGGYHDQTLRVWDVASGESLWVLHGHEHAVTSIVFSLDGSAVMSGSQDSTVRYWDLATGDSTQLTVGAGIFYTLELSADGTMLMAATNSRTIVIIDTTSLEIVFETHDLLDTGWRAGAWSPDGASVLLAGNDQIIHIFDVASQTFVGELTGHVGNIQDVTYSPDGSLIASAGGLNDATVRLWDAASGETLAILENHSKWVENVMFNADGTMMVTSSTDVTIRFWGVPES